jgi:hypothetical protein
MTVGEAMQQVESDRFSALTNLASNVKTFLRIAAAQPETDALLRILANTTLAVSQISGRALELSAASADPDHEHPADAALAVYLWLLGNHPHESGPVAAAILKEPGRFFWARKLAEPRQAPLREAHGNGAGAASATNGAAAADAHGSRRQL